MSRVDERDRNKIDSNDDIIALATEAKRLGFQIGMISRVNEQMIAEKIRNETKKEDAEMLDKWRSLVIVLPLVSALIGITTFANGADSKGDRAIESVAELKADVSKEMGRIAEKAEAAKELAQQQGEKNIKQDGQIEAMQATLLRVEAQQSEMLKILMRWERNNK